MKRFDLWGLGVIRRGWGCGLQRVRSRQDSLWPHGQWAGAEIISLDMLPPEPEPAHLTPYPERQSREHPHFLLPGSHPSLEEPSGASLPIPEPWPGLTPGPTRPSNSGCSPGCHPWLTRRPCCSCGPGAWSVRPGWPRQPHPRCTGCRKGRVRVRVAVSCGNTGVSDAR